MDPIDHRAAAEEAVTRADRMLRSLPDTGLDRQDYSDQAYLGYRSAQAHADLAALDAAAARAESSPIGAALSAEAIAYAKGEVLRDLLRYFAAVASSDSRLSEWLNGHLVGSPWRDDQQTAAAVLRAVRVDLATIDPTAVPTPPADDVDQADTVSPIDREIAAVSRRHADATWNGFTSGRDVVAAVPDACIPGRLPRRTPVDAYLFAATVDDDLDVPPALASDDETEVVGTVYDVDGAELLIDDCVTHVPTGERGMVTKIIRATESGEILVSAAMFTNAELAHTNPVARLTVASPEAFRVGRPTVEHQFAGGWVGPPGACGASCACGVTYDGFDTIAEAGALVDQHIAQAAGAEPGNPSTPDAPAQADLADETTAIPLGEVRAALADETEPAGVRVGDDVTATYAYVAAEPPSPE